MNASSGAPQVQDNADEDDEDYDDAEPVNMINNSTELINSI